jgi:hypothetical protein
MDDEVVCEFGSMERVVHDPRVHKVVEQNSERVDERNPEELVCVHAHRERAAIVPEDVVFYGNEFLFDQALRSNRSCVDPELLVPWL